MIFPMSGSNTFKTSRISGPHYCFRNSHGAPFSPTMYSWKKILQNMNQMVSFFSLQRVFLFLPFQWRKIKYQIAGKRTFLRL